MNNRSLWIVCVAGLVVRLLFILFGAEVYYGRENIYEAGDTQAWTAAFLNWLHTGTFTLNPEHEYGYFGRMPGFSFFIGIFYFLSGKDLDTAYSMIGWFQTLLDVVAVALMYKIGLRLFGSRRFATFVGLLYALYPFIIVWTPLAYSEAMSVFFMIAAVYLLTHPEIRSYYGWCGALLGVGALFRPQLLVLIPLVGLYLLYKYRHNVRLMWMCGAWYAAAIVLTFGLWPARNYINHGKLIITQDLRGIKNWNKDVLGYLQYIYSVKAEWEPQFSQIIENRPVDVPEHVNAVPGDSLKFLRAVELAKTCGSGFSHWRGYWKEPFTEPNCNEEIASIFTQLRQNQVDHNKMNFYVWVPLQNLKKSIFKTTLTDTDSAARKAASLLFIYRTFLILIGLVGCAWMIRTKHSAAWMAWITLGFFVTFYLVLCAGTSPQMRNIEMRYFLLCDVLMLLPAAWLLGFLYSRWRPETPDAPTT
ncbi:MAG TPA: glycosyltransferase family 39 protein [Chitinophagales bacterium]|nr:glycosyltransferase family 39 protein [Chitinophagales bacterium]